MSAGMFAGVNGAVRALTEDGGGAVIGTISDTGEIDFGFIPSVMFFVYNGNYSSWTTCVLAPPQYDFSKMIDFGSFSPYVQLKGTTFNFGGSESDILDRKIIAFK